MAPPVEKLSIELKFNDAGSQAVIEKLRGSLKRLEMGAAGVKPRINDLRKEILAQGSASVKSVANINAQRSALQALRDEARIGGVSFKQLTADIKKLDAELGKSGVMQGGGRGGRNQKALAATQIAGAVVSGGIFGGPEGAIGGLGGAAMGGVSGAYAGAAIGAQVGNIRSSIADAADYAAQIGKLKIALEGVTSGQDDYNSALQTARQVTAQLNVPQENAIRGITRLTAAVTGAGGPVGAAETTFKNVTAAIKATGGSSEDVRGAITAMVQVFSKGKVSAEELSGQLGERLPGAVTMFAKANKMTLPELQKNLKAGTVGLNELMKFIELLGVEFEGTARTIAESNEEAGARLTVAFDDMKVAVGDSLLETGANLQDAFAGFIDDITPNVVSSIELIKKAVSAFSKVFLPAAAGITTFILLVKGASIVSALGGIGLAIAALVVKIKVLSAGLATVGILLATNPLFLGIAAVSGIVAGIVAITSAINDQAKATERLVKAGGMQEATGAEKAEAISTLKKQIGEQNKIIRDNPAGRKGQGSAAQNTRRRNAINEKARLERDLNFVTRVRKRPAIEPFKFPEVKPPPGGDTGGSAAKIADREADAFNQILAKLTKRNALEAETNKFERERIKIRTRAAQEISQIDERVSDSRKRELFDLVEINRLEGLRKIDAEELDAQVKETLSMDFASLFKKEQSKIQKFVTDAQDSLKDLQQVAINVAQGIGNAVGNAMTNGVMGLIEGTKNAKEVFADFLKSVGQILAQEGAKMIATYIAIGIAKLFAGMPGFGKPGSFETGTGLTGFASQPSTAGFNPSVLFGKAGGGPVNAGRPYMVGERGPEMFIPGSNGGIMRNEDMRRMMGNSPAGAGAPQMNFTFETTNIGGTEFVSREQLEQAMTATRRQATNDGAKRGMSMTLDKMQNSPRTRSRVGIS